MNSYSTLRTEHGDLYALSIGRIFLVCVCLFCDILMSEGLLRVVHVLEHKSKHTHDCYRYIHIVIDHESLSAIAIVSND